MRRITAISVLAIAATAMYVGPANAATASSAWLGNPSLGTALPGSTVENFKQKVGPDGTTTLVWVNENDDLRMVRIAPNGRYATPVTVNLLPNDTSAGSFDFAMDKNGAGAIIWRDTSIAGSEVKVRRFDKKGRLAATAATVTTGFPTGIATTSVAIASDGVITAVWNQGSPSRVIVKRLAANSTVLREYTDLCKFDSPVCGSPIVVGTGSGVSTIVWQEQLNGSSDLKLRTNQIDGADHVVFVLDPSGPVSACKSLPCSKAVSSPSSGSFPEVSLKQSSGGGTFVVWKDLRVETTTIMMPDPGNPSVMIPMPGPDINHTALFARKIEANGTPATAGTQTIIAETTTNHSTADLAVNAVGSAIVTWVENPGGSPVKVFYRRLSTTGSIGTSNYVDDTSDSMRSSVSLASNGTATIAWLKAAGDVNWVDIPSTNQVTRFTKISGNKSTNNTQGPVLAGGKDGTVIATWLNGSDSARKFASQVNTKTPTLAALKFPSRFKSRQRSGQVKINSSKFGTAIVTIAPASRAVKFRTRVSRIAVPAGSTTVTFNTRGLVRGKYKVTVQLVDLAGLKVTKTAKLLVTS